VTGGPARRPGEEAGRTPAPAAAERPRLGRANLARRSRTIAWGLPLVTACLWVGGWPLAAGVAALSLACLRELWPLGRAVGAEGPPPWELGPAALVVVAGAALGGRAAGPALGAGVAIVGAGAAARAARAPDAPALRRCLAGTLWSLLGLLYVPWLLGAVCRLRASAPHALAHALGAVGLVWLADVSAFLLGSAVGRRALAPAVSPAKTLEGAVGGVAAAGLGGFAAAPLLGLGRGPAAVVGAALAVAGLAGDLWESLLKRAAGVKDSGTAVAGHGGVLDRFDSLLFGAPVAYWLFTSLPWR
jgi:phosphatidate cytidylyltransferase